jgi:ribosomal protein L22
LLYFIILFSINFSRDIDNATKGNCNLISQLLTYNKYFYFIAVKARVSHLRVHYKHCREISSAIRGMQLAKAKKYLQNVIVQKAAIPFTKYNGGTGRHAMAKQHGVPGDKCGFPVKATKSFIDLLTNIEANAEVCSMYIHCHSFLT